MTANDHRDGSDAAELVSIDRGIDSPPLLELTLEEALASAAERWPDTLALISRHERVHLTYAELEMQVNRLAAGLLELGLRPGDRVAIWAPNSAPWTLLQFATAKAGLIFVTFNTAYRQVELAHVLALSGARAIVAAPGFKSIDYVAELGQIDAPALEWRIMLGASPPEGWIAFDSVGSDDLGVLDSVKTTNNDPVNIQFTSGTTGRPKGVTLSHRNILNNGYFVGTGAGLEAGDRLCIPVPLFHCFGMVMGNLACVAHGATMVYPAAAFDPAATLAAIAEEGCTHCYGVPTMFIAMLGLPDFSRYDLTHLRGGIMAGSICPVEVMNRVIDRMHMRHVVIAYGMTETSPVSTQTRVDDPLDLRVETVGRVLPHIEVKIVDESGTIVPRGVQGELCTRGYSVMAGYWNDAKATADAIDEDRFMHSGDLATMDAGGYIRITGRAKDMIIRGGENISPREIEEFLYELPGVRDVTVVGIPDEQFGEVVCAWIVKTPGMQIDVTDVKEACRGKLAHYKIPGEVRFVEALPITPSGKVQKFLIREAMIAERQK